ncbi:hypothetical protein, partial [Streptomyces sp. SID11385]|uniref:hypothetical protein n=1 Tax=Streptomyces sp. SID11385 TaxID=2706031 RepID=UPI0013C6187E
LALVLWDVPAEEGAALRTAVRALGDPEGLRAVVLADTVYGAAASRRALIEVLLLPDPRETAREAAAAPAPPTEEPPA